MRYTHYQATFKNVQTDELVTEARPFTEAQLSANHCLHEDLSKGVSLNSAQRMVDSWNRCCSPTSLYFL